MIDPATINGWSEPVAREQLSKCCASTRWCELMLKKRPFSSHAHLLSCAETVWKSLKESDWLEAFLGHPKIGDLQSLRKKYHGTTEWTKKEQSAVADASDALLTELSILNEAYASKFGFIFIVCATGKTAQEMLDILRVRIKNERAIELQNAAEEQRKIMILRLEKL